MKHVAHTRRRGVREHGKAQVCGRLVVMQLVLAGAITDKGVIVTTKLADHVAQREDGSEDELSVVGGAVAAARGGALGWQP